MISVMFALSSCIQKEWNQDIWVIESWSSELNTSEINNSVPEEGVINGSWGQDTNELQWEWTTTVETEKKDIKNDQNLLVKKDDDPDSDALAKKAELSPDEIDQIRDFDFCLNDPDNPICWQPVNFPYCDDIYWADAKPGFDEIEKMIEWPMYKDFPDDPRVQILNEAAKPDGFEKAKVWARKCAWAIVK